MAGPVIVPESLLAMSPTSLAQARMRRAFYVDVLSLAALLGAGIGLALDLVRTGGAIVFCASFLWTATRLLAPSRRL